MIPPRRKLATAEALLQRRLNEHQPLNLYEIGRVLDLIREADEDVARMEDEPVPIRLRQPAQPRLRLVNPEDHRA